MGCLSVAMGCLLVVRGCLSVVMGSLVVVMRLLSVVKGSLLAAIGESESLADDSCNGVFILSSPFRIVKF